MKESAFCYSCRTHHPLDQMHQIRIGHGLRWRCRRSIVAAQCSIAERDAFGRQQTAINSADAQQKADRYFPSFEQRRLQR